jgi:hypothetical protein
MKNMVKITGMLIILLLTGSSLSAQRGMHGFRSDTAFINQRHDSIRMHMAQRRMAMNGDSLDWRIRHSDRRMPDMVPHNFGRGYREWRNPGMDRRYMRAYNFRNQRMSRDMRMQQRFYGNFREGDRPGMMAYNRGVGQMRHNTPGRMIMESMPGVTEKQKEELVKLNEKNKDEMKKFREKQQEAFKSMREDHRKKVMNILTDDQKKWLEENAPERN